MKNPIQPLIVDDHGTTRFQANAIVKHLLDVAPIGLNELAFLDFTRDDREQFAQLIGYSLSGFSELGYVAVDTCAAAEEMLENPDPRDAKIEALQATLDRVRKSMKEVAGDLFNMHPDDLGA